MMLAPRATSTLWIVLLTAAAILTSMALACAMPFTALAALAATQMRARDGVATMLLAWGANQAIGFGLLHYPTDPATLLWGAGLGAASVAAVAAARWAAARGAKLGEVGGVALAFVAANVAFKLVVLGCALRLGGVATTLSPSITARLFVEDGAILVALARFYRLLVTAGVPAAPQGRLAAVA